MKKFLCLAAAAAVLALLSGCSSIPKYQNEKGTPEDSVVLYGSFFGNDRMVFSQMNPKFPADNLDFQITKSGLNGYLITKPLKPGSVYRWQYVGGHNTYSTSGYNSAGRVQTQTHTMYWISHYPMNIQYMDIKVPSKPGVYFLGIGDTKTSYNEAKITFGEDTKGKTFESYKLGGSLMTGYVLGKKAHLFEIAILNAAIEAYEGTAWEKLFQNRLDDINAEEEEKK